MTCPNCGAVINDNRRFCGKCGTDLAPPPAVEPPTAPVAPAWGAPSQWGGPPPPPPPAPPASAGDRDPFAPPDLYAPPPGVGVPPGYPPPGYAPPPAYPPPAYPPPGYPPPPAGWPGYAPARTNGLAVASLVVSLVGWVLCGVGSVAAIVLGFVARDQINRSQGRERGTGMATAGIVIGFIAVALWLVFFVISLAAAGNGA